MSTSAEVSTHLVGLTAPAVMSTTTVDDARAASMHLRRRAMPRRPARASSTPRIDAVAFNVEATENERNVRVTIVWPCDGTRNAGGRRRRDVLVKDCEKRTKRCGLSDDGGRIEALELVAEGIASSTMT